MRLGRAGTTGGNGRGVDEDDDEAGISSAIGGVIGCSGALAGVLPADGVGCASTGAGGSTGAAAAAAGVDGASGSEGSSGGLDEDDGDAISGGLVGSSCVRGGGV